MKIRLSEIVPAAFGASRTLGVLGIWADCFRYHDHGFSYDSLHIPRFTWNSAQAMGARDRFFAELLKPVLRNLNDLPRLLHDLSDTEEGEVELEIAEERFHRIPYCQIKKISWLRRFVYKEGILVRLMDGREIAIRPGYYSPWGLIIGRGAVVDVRRRLKGRIRASCDSQ